MIEAIICSEKRQIEVPTYMDYIGQQFGSYRLIQKIGEGGFAEVYLGEHVRLAMKAAIKILRMHLVGEDIEIFQREAQTIATLSHPHIIRLLDFDVQNGVPFLVLDYAPNGSLRQNHSRGSVLPLTQVVGYVKQIASALQYAHDRRLIHRDIKPENLLISERGELLLSDFGIATIAHSTSSMNMQTSMGTLAYMAPEQIQGKPRPASDQYALAVMVYQWLSGEMPFKGSSTEVIAQHLAVPPVSLRSKVPQLSSAVEQVVMRGLAKDPKERFGSVQEFSDALELAAQEGIASTQREAEKVHLAQTGSFEPTLKNAVLAETVPSNIPQGSWQTPPAANQILARTPLQPATTKSVVSKSKGKRRFVIWSALAGIAIIIVVVLGSVMWPTLRGKGTGTLYSPLILSAGDSGVQQIGVTVGLSHMYSSPDENPVLRLDTIQLTNNQMLVGVSVTRGNDSQQSFSVLPWLAPVVGLVNLNRTINFDDSFAKFNANSATPIMLRFPGTTPKAGEKWNLDLSIGVYQDSNPLHSDNAGYWPYVYEQSYLQF